MGRTRAKKQIAATKSSSDSSKTAANTPSIPSLLEKAQDLVVQCDYQLAARFIQRVLEQDASNAIAREMRGVVELETGDLENAKQTFSSLLPPHPNAVPSPPHSAYLYLAQLSDDDPRQALKYYQTAVDGLVTQLKGKERETDAAIPEDLDELKSNIVRALIGQVEIWMDPTYDLCFEPEAESTCETLLLTALQTDPRNAEAMQAMASVRLSQQREADARQCLEQAWSAWKDLDPDHPKIPPISTRLALVKMFLELSLFSPALLVLQSIMASNDQDVEAWYLEGWCFYLMAENAKENGGQLEEISWQDLAQDARDSLETCRTLHTNQEHADMPLLEHTLELIQSLENQGIFSSVNADDGVDSDQDEQWEDIDSNEDVAMT
ncbi:TPR-like protein [Fistulina hepatica ATCC 64428]|nr:TPR-like protein [Fistulina hepatica ATCC 64428]